MTEDRSRIRGLSVPHQIVFLERDRHNDPNNPTTQLAEPVVTSTNQIHCVNTFHRLQNSRHCVNTVATLNTLSLWVIFIHNDNIVRCFVLRSSYVSNLVLRLLMQDTGIKDKAMT